MDERVKIRSVESLRALERSLGDGEYVFGELAGAGLRAGRETINQLRERVEEAHANLIHDDDGEADYSEIDAARSALRQFQDEYSRFRDAVGIWRRDGSESLLRGRRFLDDVVGDVERYLAMSLQDVTESSVSTATVPSSSTEPAVSGFFASGVMDDDEVRGALAILPGEHRDGANFQGIEYRNLYRSDQTIGWTLPGQATDRIEIFRHAPTGYQQDRHSFLQTIYHEVGHHVHLRDDAVWQRWQRLSAGTSLQERVTQYARTSAEEDFAESYSFYLTDPEALAALSPRRYAFMRDEVFGGRQYGEVAS